MSHIIVCRICLADNIRLTSISNTPQQELYEKFTGAKLITEDGRPETLCYLCSSQLRRFSRFYKISEQSEKYLTTLLGNGVCTTDNSKSSTEAIILQKSLYNLTMSPVQTLTLTDPVLLRNKIIVKQEPEESDTSDEEMHDDIGDLIIDTDVTDNDLMKVDMIDNKDIVHEQIADNKELINVEIENIEESIDNKVFTIVIIPEIGEITNGVNADNEKISNEVIADNIKTDGFLTDNTEIKNEVIADNREIAIEVITDSEDNADSKKIIDAVTISDSEPEFSCNQCEKKFNFAHQLYFHERLHRTKDLKCTKCDRSFTKKSSLTFHLQRMHNKINMNNGKETGKNKKGKNMVNKGKNMGNKGKNMGNKGKTMEKITNKLQLQNTNSSLATKVCKCTKCVNNFTDKSDLVKHVMSHTSAQVVVEKVLIPDLMSNKKIDVKSDGDTIATKRSSPRLAKCRKK